MNNADNIIDQLKSPEKCERFAEKYISLAKEAQRRAIEQHAYVRSNKNEVEPNC